MFQCWILVANAPYPDTPAERRAFAKLRCLRRFQRHRGVEALLHHQLQEKRLQVLNWNLIYKMNRLYYVIFNWLRSHKVSITDLHLSQSALLLTAESSALTPHFRSQNIALSTSSVWVYFATFFSKSSHPCVFKLIIQYFLLPQDSMQLLFRSCGATVHDNECREPVINFSEDTRCVYHTMMPSMPSPPTPLKDQQVKT